MIDLENIEQYRENNRIEAKRALGGLPGSIWETYSAFANTLGGLILLGVEELKDKSFRAVNLPDPEKLIKEFWIKVNDHRIVSRNILTKSNIQIMAVKGNRIIVIEVPQASVYLEPIYIDNDPVTGVFIRDGEGDFRCPEEDIKAMCSRAETRTSALLKQLVAEYLTVHKTAWLDELDDVIRSKQEEAWNQMQKRYYSAREYASSMPDTGGCVKQKTSLDDPALRELFREMEKEGTIVEEILYSEGGDKKFRYKLKY